MTHAYTSGEHASEEGRGSNVKKRRRSENSNDHHTKTCSVRNAGKTYIVRSHSFSSAIVLRAAVHSIEKYGVNGTLCESVPLLNATTAAAAADAAAVAFRESLSDRRFAATAG